MDALKSFSIPIKGIGSTSHHFDFQVDDTFFAAFEDSIIENGTFEVSLDLDKRSLVMDLEFSIQGSFKTECDRCLREIDYFISEVYEMKVKFQEGESDDIDVVFISPTANEFNVAAYIYEFIGLSVPISTICQGEEVAACDSLVDEYLGIEEHPEEEEDSSSNPFKDLLKNFDN